MEMSLIRQSLKSKFQNHNLRKWIRFRVEILFNLFNKTLKNMFSRNFNYYTVTFLL